MRVIITYNGRDGITRVLATQTESTTLQDDHGHLWLEDAAGRWSATIDRNLVYAMAIILVEAN